MANILCVTNGLSSLLYSSLELLRRLDAAGHHVTYASIPEVRQIVESHGVRFLSLESIRHADFLESDARKGLIERLLTMRRRRREGAHAMVPSDFLRELERLHPDLVLIDEEMHEHIIAAAARGVPMALLSIFASGWRLRGMPPPHHLVRPGIGLRGTGIGIWLLWRGLRLRKLYRRTIGWIRAIGCDRVSVLKCLAALRDFDFSRETDFDQWLIPFTYRRLPILSLHALEFEFPHTPPDGVHYIGPMISERRVDARVTEDVRKALAALEERRSAGDANRLIYAGFGSFLTVHPNLLMRLIDAVATVPEWDLVISRGGQGASLALSDVPANVHLFDWLPQPDVLRYTDAAIVHGGIGTVDECVLRGVPMLLYCGFETDMGGNTARVQHHGLGIVGDAKRDTPVTIRRSIDRLLMEPGFRDRAQRFQSRYAAYARNQVAERTVEELLRSGLSARPVRHELGEEPFGTLRDRRP